jgi:hypothetical protein
MTFTDRQKALLSVALTVFYDQVCKDGTTDKMKQEILELSNLVAQK